ncbi:MAG: LCP family protein [Oscillospiraceae bacterium]|nr:LCP family protein [Oscillospiraceae bacterium]
MSKKKIIFICLLGVGVILFAIAGVHLLLDSGSCIGLEQNSKKNNGDDDPENGEGGGSPLPGRVDDEHREGVYTFILAGTDKHGYHTDVLMVAALDADNKTLNIMSIPRDTQVPVARSTKKVNSAWLFGEIDQLRDELSTVIGFIPDYYVVIDLDGFVALVDEIGGVDFDVPQNMNYEDPEQGLFIHLQKGPQKLYGDQAIQLVRFRRYREGDIKRVEVTQNFLKETVKQTLNVNNLVRVPALAKIVRENVKTDLSLTALIELGEHLMNLDNDNIVFHTLPGDYAMYKKQAYWLVFPDKALALINETINPFTTPITEDNVNYSRLRDD